MDKKTKELIEYHLGELYQAIKKLPDTDNKEYALQHLEDVDYLIL